MGLTIEKSDSPLSDVKVARRNEVGASNPKLITCNIFVLDHGCQRDFKAWSSTSCREDISRGATGSLSYKVVSL